MKKIFALAVIALFAVGCSNSAEDACNNFVDLCSDDATYGVVAKGTDCAAQAKAEEDKEITDADQKIIDCMVDADKCSTAIACGASAN